MPHPRWCTSIVVAVSLLLCFPEGPARAEECSHPLTPALNLARATQNYVLRSVGDFTCILVKRERIDGKLMLHQYLQMKVRHEVTSSRAVVTPYSVYVRYLNPKRVRGREVLYITGWNDGKLRARKGGGRFSYVQVNVDPTSDAALRESLHPITEIGISSLIRRLVERIEDDMIADPTGKNTQVQFFQNAKVSGRECTHIRVRHPVAQPGLTFFLADVYVDDQLHVPIRIEGYDWPESDSSKPALLEEYTFTDLRLNVGLTDADFRFEPHR